MNIYKKISSPVMAEQYVTGMEDGVQKCKALNRMMPYIHSSGRTDSPFFLLEGDWILTPMSEEKWPHKDTEFHVIQNQRFVVSKEMFELCYETIDDDVNERILSRVV